MTNLYDSFGRSESPTTTLLDDGRLSSNSTSGSASAGSPTLSNGDSADSLRSPPSNQAGGMIRAMPAMTRIYDQVGAATKQPTPEADRSSSSSSSADQHQRQKSPILVKYNYYDHNGLRQEQPNETTTSPNQPAPAANKIQRQLSPTFKQSLDQIVKQSQQLQMAVAAAASTTNQQADNRMRRPASESPDWLHQHHLKTRDQTNNQLPPPPSQFQPLIGPHSFGRRYKMSSYEQRCLRCQKTVYQMDKVGPLKDFTFYHQNCFKCRECGTKLTLKTYFNNQQSSGDQEVYCHRHCPKTGPGKLDNQSVGIRTALNAPKVFDITAYHQALLTNEQQHEIINNSKNSSDRKSVV